MHVCAMRLMNGKCISVRLFKVCISLGEGERDAIKKLVPPGFDNPNPNLG